MRIFGNSKFNVREFISNDKNLLDYLDTELKLSGPNVRVLGLLWNQESDTISIPYKEA